MTGKQHPFYKYLFLFGKGKKKVPLFGKEIANFWNDVYDLFDIEGKMIVQKLNGEDFTEDEIKELFWDLYEDMSEDNAVISLYISSLSKLDFSHSGDIYEFPKIKEQLDKLDDSQLDLFFPAVEKVRRGFCELNLNWALEEKNKRELKELVKGFKIKKVFGLEAKENKILKNYLNYFKKSKEHLSMWAINLRHILDKNKNLTTDLKKVYALLCNSSIKNSTHEGQGINLGKELKEYTPEQLKFCERTIKQYLQSLINKAGLNKK